MRIFTCEHEWEAMLTCIYEASASGLGHKNIRLMLEPIQQYTLFDEYVHVPSDSAKAAKVMDAIVTRISYQVYRELALASMAYEEDVLDNIYHVLLLGFHHGPSVLEMVQYADVMRNAEIRLRVKREANRFQEFVRFHQIGNTYISHIEPKSKIVTYLGPIFADRMPSIDFMIIDDVHKEALVHPADSPYYLRRLTEEEFNRLQKTEEVNDQYTDMWKTFFQQIAIQERHNERCQTNLFPKWSRKHVTEFM